MDKTSKRSLDLTSMACFITSIIISYFALNSSLYVKLFLPEEITYIGSANQFSTNCISTNHPESICTLEYQIPVERRGLPSSKLSMIVGKFLSASEISCSTGQLLRTYDNPKQPGEQYNLYTTLQTVDIPSDCKSVIVKAWSRKNHIRYGYIGGAVSIGSPRAVEAALKIHNFFSNGITFIIAICFLALAISSRLSNLLPEFLKIFEEKKYFWILFLISSTNTIQELIPFFSSSLINHKIVFASSIIINLFPLLDAIDTKYRNGASKNFALSLKVILVCLSLTSMQAWALTAALFVSASIAVILYFQSQNKFWLFYFLSMLLTLLSILNIQELPGSMLVPHYIGLLIICSLIKSARKQLITKSLEESSEVRRSLHDILGPVKTLTTYAKKNTVSKEAAAAITFLEKSILKALPEKGLLSLEYVNVQDMIASTIQISGVEHVCTIKGFTKAACNLPRVSIEKCLINLIRNSSEVSPLMEKIEIEFEFLDDFLILKVMDRGPGPINIYKSEKTTKQSGSGLGIASVEQILKDLGGSLYYQGRTGGGTVATIKYKLQRHDVFINKNEKLVLQADFSTSTEPRSDKGTIFLYSHAEPFISSHRSVYISSIANTRILKLTRIVLIEDDKYIAQKWISAAREDDIEISAQSKIDFKIYQCDAIFIDRFVGNTDTTSFASDLHKRGYRVYGISRLNGSDSKLPPWRQSRSYVEMFTQM